MSNRTPRSNQRQRITIKPQFSIEQVHISPFDAVRVYNTDGSWHWEPIGRNLHPTGIEQFDALLAYFAEGHYDRKSFYERVGISSEWHKETGNPYLDFVFVLTGMSIRELHNQFKVRTADLLLQYTDMTVEDIAPRAGFAFGPSMAIHYRKTLHCTPLQRRKALRKLDNRVGWYRVVNYK